MAYNAMRIVVIRFAVALAALPITVVAQVVGFALEPKVTLENGMIKVAQSPVPDSAVFFEFSGATARKLGQVFVPTHLWGPPSSVAVSVNGSFALVSASMRLDPNKKDGTSVSEDRYSSLGSTALGSLQRLMQTRFLPDDRLSVVDLAASPLRVMQTIRLGASPSSVAMSPTGMMALAMHPNDDSVTVLSIAADRQVTIMERLPIGRGAGPVAAAFSPDGRRVLLTRFGDNKVSLYAVEGLRLKPLRDMVAGVRPFSVSYCGGTGLAVVSNMGVNGDADTISLIDTTAAPPRVVDTVSVGPVPEGVACAPDGQYVAALIQNMSNLPTDNPLYSPNSKLVLLKIDGKHLYRISEASSGVWTQGVGFLDDSRTLFAESIGDRSVYLFRIEDDALKVAAPPLVFQDGAPVAHGIAGR
ncbi:hypothetical protein PG1C_02715 [Rugosibacter aromaticivorans]|uniref:Mandelate racemase n=1 Tax=Rugosibacter aromaticivorans TaxID=1565605 RepID=A0A0C5JJZ7_9PROT|nr:hypothetical protein PG1C_02715 [Rugosibacter aromaticivorans]